MNQSKSDPLSASISALRGALAMDTATEPSRWAEAVYRALGKLADAIQDDMHAGEKMSNNLGDINPDFASVPITERHLESMRSQRIKLGEQAHQLRTALRQTPLPPLEQVQLRLDIEQLVAKLEKARREDDTFLLDTVNSNPGAGE